MMVITIMCYGSNLRRAKRTGNAQLNLGDFNRRAKVTLRQSFENERRVYSMWVWVYVWVYVFALRETYYLLFMTRCFKTAWLEARI